MSVDTLAYIPSAVICLVSLVCLFLFFYWEPHIYQPGTFEPPLYKKIGFIAILRPRSKAPSLGYSSSCASCKRSRR